MNRFIHFEYKDKDFVTTDTTDDYKNQPDSSLDSALKPALAYVEQLNHYIEKARKLRHFPSEHGLTEDESVAVYLYMDDWGDQSLHRVLNQILQSGDQKKVRKCLGFLKIFNAALEKLPIVKDTIWRGLPIDIAKKLKENEELILCSVTSCSSSVDIIKYALNSSSSVLCSIQSLNGKNVCHYTSHTDDQEVVLRPGTRLRVKSKGSNNKQHRTDIVFEEISEIDDEQTVTNDVLMPSANEKAIRDADYLTTDFAKTTKEMNNDSVPKNEGTKESLINAVIIFSNGDRYKLAYLNGKKEGYGKYYCTDGKKLQGQEADDNANGEGICSFKDGVRFIGAFERGHRHGHGILLNLDGTIQACAWSDDEKSGQCLKIKSHKGHYEWRDIKGEHRWYGAYDDDNGNKYIGNVVDGKADGLGIRIWNDASRYEGNFKNDKKHGFGTYQYTDRDKYTGHWDDDEISGFGTLLWRSGTCYKGEFAHGKKHGEGELNFSNGQKQKGKWKKDKYVA